MLALAIAALLGSTVTLADASADPAPLAVRDCRAGCRSARDAIELAAAAAPGRAPAGYYQITVRAVGVHRGRFYINSERDYRDQRNISLSFGSGEAKRLVRLMAGRSVEDALVGRQLVVYGRPERVRILFLDRRGPTGLYYYQTHIAVTDVPNQLFRPDA